MNKNISLMQLYSEVGVNFEKVFPYKISNLLMTDLNNNFIKDGKFLNEFDGYQLGIILTTKKGDLSKIAEDIKNPILVDSDYIICKPLVSKKNKTVDYVIYLPFLLEKKDEKIFTTYFLKAIEQVFHHLNYSDKSAKKIIPLQ
ncbi:MAG: hypothetical protein RI996_585 [Candidatus Parcubacteria bacterium]|jgi:hypothetical protein